MIRYEIQGRRLERDNHGTRIRDHVRLATADDRDAALAIADSMVADEFTTWVFEVELRAGKKLYLLLETRAATGRRFTS